MKYTVLELRNRKHQPIYVIHEIITENMTQPVFPVIRYKTRQEAETAAAGMEG